MKERAPRGPKVSDPLMELLREVLHRKRWTAVQLGEALDKHPDIVRRWLRGERRVQIEDVLAMADIIDVSLDELFGRAGAKSAPEADASIRQVVREEIAEAMLPLAPLVEIADLFLLSQELKASSRLTAARREEVLARDARHLLSRGAQESLRVAEKADDDSRIRRRI